MLTKMEKKVIFSVLWCTNCVNGSRVYSREFTSFQDALIKFDSLKDRYNVFYARLTQRVRTYENAVHIKTSLMLLYSFDKLF